MTSELEIASLISLETPAIESIKDKVIIYGAVNTGQSEEGMEQGIFVFCAPLEPIWTVEELNKFTQETFASSAPSYIEEARDYGLNGMRPSLACFAPNGSGNNCRTLFVVCPVIHIAAIGYRRAQLRYLDAHRFFTWDEIDHAKHLYSLWI